MTTCGECDKQLSETVYRVTDEHGEDWSASRFCSRQCAQAELDHASEYGARGFGLSRANRAKADPPGEAYGDWRFLVDRNRRKTDGTMIKEGDKSFAPDDVLEEFLRSPRLDR